MENGGLAVAGLSGLAGQADWHTRAMMHAPVCDASRYNIVCIMFFTLGSNSYKIVVFLVYVRQVIVTSSV